MKCSEEGWKLLSMLAAITAGSNSTGVPRLQNSTRAIRSEGPEVRSDSPKCS